MRQIRNHYNDRVVSNFSVLQTTTWKSYKLYEDETTQPAVIQELYNLNLHFISVNIFTVEKLFIQSRLSLDGIDCFSCIYYSYSLLRWNPI